MANVHVLWTYPAHSVQENACLPTTLSAGVETRMAVSTVRDASSGDILLKIVSRADAAIRAQFHLTAMGRIASTAEQTVLMDDNLLAEHNFSFWRPYRVQPVQSTFHFTHLLTSMSKRVIVFDIDVKLGLLRIICCVHHL